jgi:hypothetical protein
MPCPYGRNSPIQLSRQLRAASTTVSSRKAEWRNADGALEQKIDRAISNLKLEISNGADGERRMRIWRKRRSRERCGGAGSEALRRGPVRGSWCGRHRGSQALRVSGQAEACVTGRWELCEIRVVRAPSGTSSVYKEFSIERPDGMLSLPASGQSRMAKCRWSVKAENRRSDFKFEIGNFKWG